ncbi:hypothetical protein JCM5805K_2839 [Lactococcus lactis subsp. lactis]|uniref:Uncharacterized protein n=1 Tax=Lactococcus lactis subsp. lactis TaxID=1360 RepID=A0A0B8QSQ7_LACLL|nr:hypothetical protein JCM5805K_2839 [Lactococcus lactis subsp. lactis]
MVVLFTDKFVSSERFINFVSEVSLFSRKSMDKALHLKTNL